MVPWNTIMSRQSVDSWYIHSTHNQWDGSCTCHVLCWLPSAHQILTIGKEGYKDEEDARDPIKPQAVIWDHWFVLPSGAPKGASMRNTLGPGSSLGMTERPLGLDMHIPQNPPRVIHTLNPKKPSPKRKIWGKISILCQYSSKYFMSHCLKFHFV